MPGSWRQPEPQWYMFRLCFCLSQELWHLQGVLQYYNFVFLVMKPLGLL